MAVDEFVFIYDADGTVMGELRYWFSTLLGAEHCSLCDLTHGRFRQRAEFRHGRESLGAPVVLLHRNDLERAEHADLVPLASGRLPCVLMRREGRVEMACDPTLLATFEGDPSRLLDVMRSLSASETG